MTYFFHLHYITECNPNFQGLDLRLEHSHGFNLAKGQGGHYHYDTTPDIVEYEAYYNIADGKHMLHRLISMTSKNVSWIEY